MWWPLWIELLWSSLISAAAFFKKSASPGGKLDAAAAPISSPISEIVSNSSSVRMPFGSMPSAFELFPNGALTGWLL